MLISLHLKDFSQMGLDDEIDIAEAAAEAAASAIREEIDKEIDKKLTEIHENQIGGDFWSLVGTQKPENDELNPNQTPGNNECE